MDIREKSYTDQARERTAEAHALRLHVAPVTVAVYYFLKDTHVPRYPIDVTLVCVQHHHHTLPVARAATRAALPNGPVRQCACTSATAVAMPRNTCPCFARLPPKHRVP